MWMILQKCTFVDSRWFTHVLNMFLNFFDLCWFVVWKQRCNQQRCVYDTIIQSSLVVTWKFITVFFMNHGPLTRYVKLWVAHAPVMPGMFSPPPLVRDPDMHHGTCVTHVPWCMSESLTSCFLWSRWRGKRSRHYRRMCNPQFYVSGKRPLAKAKV